MNLSLLAATWALWFLPTSFGCAAVLSPSPAREILGGTLAFMLFAYASVWFMWRPSRFVLDANELRIVWPTWSRTIPKSAVRTVSIVSREEFSREFGYGTRVGAGGLWGGFGLLRTGRETFSTWISRTDKYVMVRLANGQRTLLITPEDAERFVSGFNAPSSDQKVPLDFEAARGSRSRLGASQPLSSSGLAASSAGLPHEP